MEPPAKWYKPVAITALLWNLMGCAAYLSDVMLTADDIAKMTEAQQALYASRPAWAVGATATAVWGGAAGCIGLLMRKKWATWLFIASLLGVVVQDLALFGMTDVASLGGPVVFVLQGLVLAIAVALVLLGRNAEAKGWIQ